MIVEPSALLALLWKDVVTCELNRHWTAVSSLKEVNIGRTLLALAAGTLPLLLLLFLLAKVPTLGLVLREAKPQVEASSDHRLAINSLCNL